VKRHSTDSTMSLLSNIYVIVIYWKKWGYFLKIIIYSIFMVTFHSFLLKRLESWSFAAYDSDFIKH